MNRLFPLSLVVAAIAMTVGYFLPQETPSAVTAKPLKPGVKQEVVSQRLTSLDRLDQLLELFTATKPNRSIHAAMRALATVEAVQMQQWWQECTAKDQKTTAQALNCLAARWVELAPNEVQIWLAAHADQPAAKVLMEHQAAAHATSEAPKLPNAAVLQDPWMRGIATALVPTAPGQAWDWARGQAEPKIKAEATLKVLRRLAAIDPVTAAGRCQEISLVDSDLLKKITLNWARIDPLATWKWLQQLGPKERAECSKFCLQILAQTDASAAANLVETSTPEADKAEAIHKIAEDLAKTQPEAAATMLLKYPQKDGAFGSHNRLMRTMLADWIATDAGPAMEWMMQSGNIGFGAAVEGSRAILKELGPDAALDFYFHAEKVKINASLDSNLCSVWASADPDGLLKLLDTDTRLDSLKEQVYQNLAIGMNPTNPQVGIDFLLSHRQGKPSPTQLNRFFNNSEMPNPEASATALANLLKRPDVRVRGTSAEYVPQSGDDQVIHTDSFSNTATRYTEAAPDKAAKWADSLPAGPGQEAARKAVAASWADLDPVGASEWIVTLPPSPARDAAVAELVKKIAPFDEERATQWESSLTDPKFKRKATTVP